VAYIALAFMPLLDGADRRPIHFIGIAGAGMSALAELFVRRGARVTGCDANPASVEDLERLGIPVATGHDPSHLAGVRAVVVSSAIRPETPELAAARAAGLPVIRRAEALAEAVAGGTLVAIAGTHGKTTTTVMTTEALAAAGRSPTGIVGGRVAEWSGNLRYGSDTLFVVEADEYDRSFLALTPSIAVVTNIEADHLDIYRDLDDIRAAFATFVKPARWVIVCADDPGANALPTPSTCEVLRYGIDSADARLAAHDVILTVAGSTFTVTYDGDRLGGVELHVPGLHNVRNALAAIASGIALGVPLDAMAPGLAGFHGVERRFQRLGEARGVAVIDDYAHHPTEIRATLDAARAAFPGRRLVVAFQPHLYTRTRDFAADFGRALARGDVVFLTEIYPAREQPLPGVSSDLIASAAAAAGRPVAWRGARGDLAGALAAAVRPGDVVLTLGAGDITRTGPELLGALAANGAAA
jgi:UDP-N-acetylmuramate--alanine ligase